MIHKLLGCEWILEVQVAHHLVDIQPGPAIAAHAALSYAGLDVHRRAGSIVAVAQDEHHHNRRLRLRNALTKAYHLGLWQL